MDPKANIERQLEIAHRLQEIGATPAPTGQSNVGLEIEGLQLAWELAELVIELNRWRELGGFDPGAAA